jgi:uncharacterized membrane protein
MKNLENVKILLLYFFLIAGGLWHILGVFGKIMSFLAGPLLIGLAIWLYYEHQTKLKRKHKIKFTLWAFIVIVFSFLIETAGVKTGVIFGSYAYGDTLWPQILNVPVAIGFAWLLMLLSSIAVIQRISLKLISDKWTTIVLVSVLMTFFDFMMEPAAITLNYWNWQNESVPFQNYLAWFVISIILIYAGQKFDVLQKRQPKLAMHAYFAQMIYFIMVLFK